MLNVSQINSIVPAISREMATKAVADAPTIKLLAANGALQVGVKGKAAVLKLSQDVNVQDSSTCGARNPLGTTALSNVYINVAQLKDESNLCPKALYSTYFSWALGRGQNPKDEGNLLPDFLRSVFSLKAAELNLFNENLIWNGDSSLTGSSPLKFTDGFLKQILAGSYIALPDTGATIVEKLQNAFLAVPVEIRTKSDFRIYIGQDMFDAYTVALSLKNIFKPTQDYTLFGTTAQLVPVSGLSGSSKIVATRFANLMAGMDDSDDVNKVIFNFSLETNQYYLDYHWSLGGTVIYPEQAGYAVLS